MTNEKRPSFQFYPKDLLSDRKVAVMDNNQLGGYLKLLCYMWMEEDCSLPDDNEELMDLSGLNEKDLAKIRRCFIALRSGSDRLTHKRLLEEREKQDLHKKKMSEAGRLGNKKRWSKPINEPSPSDRLAIAPDRSSSSSSLINNIKGKSFEHPIVQNLCKTLLSECEKQKMECRVDADLFEQIYEEFSGKINLGKGIKDCVFNRKKNHHTFIDAGNLRFWFQKGIQLEKDFERRKQTKAADKAAAIGRPQHVDRGAQTPQIEGIAEKMTWN